MINKKKWLIISSVGIILCGVIFYLVISHTEMGLWQFILIRQNKNSSWQVIDQGV